MGELAALGTAFFWAFTAILFTVAVRRVGSVVVNRMRLFFALILLSIAHLLLQGKLLPFAVEPERWIWLGLSGILGLVIGDTFLFQAFAVLGSRLAMLLMALVPVFSTILAWLFLGQILTIVQVLAILIAVAGVAWVGWISNTEGDKANKKIVPRGMLLGLGAAFGQALGLIAAQKGLQGDFSPLSGTLIRMLVAVIVIWTIALLRGQITSTLEALGDRIALSATIGATVVGPFLGVWLSLIAISLAPVGIASTLMSLTPIILLPLSRWFFKEQISGKVALGTLAALVGVAIIFVN